MERAELFETWAPPDGLWSAWAKPVLFAHFPRELPPASAEPGWNLSWAPSAAERGAIVLDLPGAASVSLGLALAETGYRPVPLFNACPPPESADVTTPPEPLAVVDVLPILGALVQGVDRLRGANLPAIALPTFLVDADRQTARRPVEPGAFDNRSVVFVTDFPSANLLASRGINRALLVREQPGTFGADLTYALQTWQRGGIELSVKWLSQPGPPGPLRLPRPGWFTGLWRRLAAFFGFRRNPAGGFGDFVPESSGG